MVVLLLACGCAPLGETTVHYAEPGDTDPEIDTGDAGDTGDETPPTALVTFTNMSLVPLGGSWASSTTWMVSGVALEPGASKEWEIETPQTVNFIWTDFESWLCWGVAALALNEGDVLAYDIPAPTGEEKTDSDGLGYCQL